MRDNRECHGFENALLGENIVENKCSQISKEEFGRTLFPHLHRLSHIKRKGGFFRGFFVTWSAAEGMVEMESNNEMHLMRSQHQEWDSLHLNSGSSPVDR